MHTHTMSRTLVYDLQLSEVLFICDAGSAGAGAASGARRASILIVEDEDLITEMYKMKFTHEGYTVYTAADGCAGLEMARQKRPDIILTDIVMPRCDGWHLLKALKRDPLLRDTPVITLSNLHDDEKRERAARLGALYFLVKSEYLPKDLAAILKTVLTARAKIKTAPARNLLIS